MKLLISYAIQRDDKHRYESEFVDITLPPVMFSFQINDELIEPEVVKWVAAKQAILGNDVKIIVLKTLHV